ncbi:MAG TPA: hypothetical protein VGC35_14400 [Allosphingosinicella sp.]
MNARGGLLVRVNIGDPAAPRQLECLARAGDHEILRRYVDDLLIPTDKDHSSHAEVQAYRWNIRGLEVYLASLKIDYRRPDFFEQYRAVSKSPGFADPGDPWDTIYRYEEIALDLISRGFVEPSKDERRIIDEIKDNRPGRAAARVG